MYKTTWRTKAMYIVFALALVFGLSLTAAMPTQQVAEAAIPVGGTFAITSGSITLTADGNISGNFVGTSTGVSSGPYYSEMAFGIDDDQDGDDEYTGDFWAKVWVDNKSGSGSDTIDFIGEYLADQAPGGFNYVLPVNGGLRTTDADGDIRIDLAIDDGAAPDWDMWMEGHSGIPEIMPKIALDVKGSVQKFILVNVPLFSFTPVPGQPGAFLKMYEGLMEQDFAEMIWEDNPSEKYPQQDPDSGTGPLSYPEELPETLADVQLWSNPEQILEWSYTLGVWLNPDNVEVIAGGDPGDSFIELYSRAPGDLAVRVKMNWVGAGGVEREITTETGLPGAEKKWGVIDHTVLDLNPEYPETPDDPDYTWSANAGTVAEPEVEFFSDFVYAWFFWGEGVPTPIHLDTAGHAIVHWWLILDDEAGANEAAIQEIMDYLNEDPGCQGECPGCGRYDPSPAESPKELIDDVWILNEAEHTIFTNEVDGYYYLDKSPDETYIKTVTQDDWPGETRGLTMVTTENTDGEDILVVTLTEYPDEYNGENPVCVEMGKKSYGVPPPPEHVKTPQLAWAGQKVVLEQDWSDVIDCSKEYTAIYHLEGQSVGEISIGGDNEADESAASAVYVHVTCANPTSEAIIESEVQGEADINVKLYEGGWYGPPDTAPLMNYGFLVYYMAFEDVTLAEDITPSADMESVTAGEDVNVAVQVRGWFKSDQLPGTARPAVDTDDDLIYELPAGRYVMPDDWWDLSEDNFELRPNWDLMDEGPEDNITSTKVAAATYLETGVLGPFDNVTTIDTEPEGMAEEPCIGPFSTLQLWSTEMMWVAQATVPSSYDPEHVRNTVVPDGEMSWYDAPMPQGLVIFRIISAISADTDLSELLKGDLVGYGINSAGTEFESPFYAAEVPSSEFIPANDYNWDSWNSDGPYPYWEDLQIKSIGDTEPLVENTQDMEVYCDNHGIAAMTVDGVDNGSVTIRATADYPAAFKKGKYGPVASGEIPINWGYIEQNPHFEADDTEVAVEDVITFDNLSVCGSCPYINAQWDFNNDGVWDTPLSPPSTTGSANAMKDVTWAYEEPGVYTVKLQMTDMATTRYEVRDDYIIVGGATPVETWSMLAGLDEDPMAVNIWQYPDDAVLVTLADIEGDVVADTEVAVVWNYTLGQGWKFFKPGWGDDNTLLQLVPGNYYIGIANTATEWEIPQE